jgi:phosphoribosylamine---glycine ligase
LPEAKDYKMIGENDTGLNTGGMGAVSPVHFASKDFMEKVETRVIQPTVVGLKKEGIPYKGFIFIGLMNVNGDPYVIEYNVRMGDPETEVVIPRIKSDFLELLIAVGNQSLNQTDFEIDQRFATTVIMASGGYPGDYEKAKKVTGLDQVSDSLVFHSGTKKENETVITNGGRVFAITSFGETLKAAVSNSQKNADKIHFDKKYYRKDIGFDLMKN